MSNYNFVLQIPLISNEDGKSPFWNNECMKIQSDLWLPHTQTTLNNFKIKKENHWQKILIPNQDSIENSLLNLSKGSIVAISENYQEKEALIIATKKIRFYPKNEKAYIDAMSLYRRAYNLAVAVYINGNYLDEDGKLRNLRPEIRKICGTECIDKNQEFHSVICDNAVLEAKKTFLSVASKNKANKGNKSGFSSISFKSKKGVRHSFTVDRLPQSFMPSKNKLGEIYLTESVPKEAVKKTCIITCDKNRWFLNVQQHINIKSEIQGKVKCVAVDQGVRTFGTTYSPNEVAIIGDSFAKEKLYPLMKKVDECLSYKQKILNKFKNTSFKDLPQWARDRIVFLDNKITKIKCKKEDLIADLHHRFAYYLVQNYDCIFLPFFKSKEMVKRKGKVRTIRRNTARQMLDLNHYQFKLRLKWYAKKYGKKVIDCNESYTSKTYSWSGFVDEKLGSKKIIKDQDMIVDRDINGARNIYIKCLSKAA